jgi:hypothetical protein
MENKSPTEQENTEPELTQAPQEEEYAHMLNKRILFKKSFARVKYAGNLHHKIDNPKIKRDDLWLGIEWEDPTKGKS